MQVPDRKGKAAVPAEGDSHPEQRMLEALKQAMQLSPAAGDAVVRELRSLQGAAGTGDVAGRVDSCSGAALPHAAALQVARASQHSSTGTPFLQCRLLVLHTPLNALVPAGQSPRRTASWTSGCCWRC